MEIFHLIKLLGVLEGFSMTTEIGSDNSILLCSECFTDEGLKIDATKHGIEQPGGCPNCGHSNGKKLTKEDIESLAWRFFVGGTTIRADYGAAPVIQCNPQHYGKTEITTSPWLINDIALIEKTTQMGFFYYGPRLWMVGEVEPLKSLIAPSTRELIIDRILKEYPEYKLPTETKFYRLRVNPERPNYSSEYDSPPIQFAGNGRLDSANFPVMYGSQDLDICIHECRASATDDIYVATLKVNRELRLLDLTHLLEEDVTEFESLDMAVHMLFLAKSHSYEISRAIALAAKNAGFDGLIYPSFFSLIRTGGHPFETVYGMSIRRIHPERNQYSEAFIIPNFALFGRPLEDDQVSVQCLNRLVLTQIGYQGYFGPVQY